ncbi:MAG: hypothetical protein ACKOYM_00485, partial [Actinomycetes bacterium]
TIRPVLDSVRLRSGARRRMAAGLGLMLLLVGAVAGPAAADGAEPSRFVAETQRVRPETTGTRFAIVGNDTFVQITASAGVEVLVPGYDDEPYLRIRPDGRVEVNRRSPAYWLNQSSRGASTLPPTANSSAPPVWAPTGSLRTASWHDHRIHWMAPDDPKVAPGAIVGEWSIPFTVNGTLVTAEGRLRYLGPTVSVVQLIALLATTLTVGALAFRWTHRATGQLAGLFGASMLAIALAWCAFRASPPTAGASLVPVLVPVAALLLTALAPALPRLPLRLAEAAALLGWAIVRSDVLWSPAVPSTLPGATDRFGTAVVLGVAAGIAVRLLRPAAASDDRVPADG